MIRKIAATAIVSASALSFATVAFADDIPATPMNHGPMMMRGMGPMGDIVNLGLMPANMIGAPVVGAGDGAAAEPAGAKAPMKRHHTMMKKKKMMMKKKAM